MLCSSEKTNKPRTSFWTLGAEVGIRGRRSTKGLKVLCQVPRQGGQHLEQDEESTPALFGQKPKRRGRQDFAVQICSGFAGGCPEEHDGRSDAVALRPEIRFLHHWTSISAMERPVNPKTRRLNPIDVSVTLAAGAHVLFDADLSQEKLGQGTRNHFQQCKLCDRREPY